MEPTTSFKQKQFNNTKKLAFWTLIWVLATALATFGPEFIWENSLFTYAGVGLFLITGAAMILANRKHILNLDELQQRMHLEAMAISLGVAVVLGLGLSILEQQDLLGFKMDFAFMTVVISITYLAGLAINTRRFK
jgi:hypothetical protein